MSDILLSLTDAVELLKNAVKESHIDHQKHLDLSLIDAGKRIDYQKALMVVQSAVARGEIKQSEVNSQLGLN